MSIAARLFAEGFRQGWVEGYVEGWLQGYQEALASVREQACMTGNIELLEHLNGLTPPTLSELEAQSLDRLQARFSKLEQKYTSRFK